MKRKLSAVVEVASQEDFNEVGGVEKDSAAFSDHKVDGGIARRQRVDLDEAAREVAGAKRLVEVDDDLELSAN